MAMNRHFPGVHKLIAWPQRGQGDLEEARKTMSRAVVYEAPWDDKNRESNIALLEELLRQPSAEESGDGVSEGVNDAAF